MNSRTFVSTTQIPTRNDCNNTIETTRQYGHLVQAAMKMGGQLAGEIANPDEHKITDQKGDWQGILAEKDVMVSKLKNEIRHKDRIMVSLRQEFLLAIERYRQSIITSSPEIPQELIRGETVEQLESSLTKARGLFEKIRKQVNLKTKSANKVAANGKRPSSSISLTPSYESSLALD